MAVPELVFCPGGDGFKTFPGNVVAVCAADFLNGARGSLTTEADALSASGTVVRDTQQVSNILSNSNTAYQAADDTLEITGLPLVDTWFYEIWGTFRIEGYTDVTDGPLLRTGFMENWVNAAVVGAHTTTGTETGNVRFAATPPPLPYYRASIIGSLDFATGDSIFVRLAAESGTTIELLLDQVFFFPSTLTLPNATEFFHADGTTLGLVADTQDGMDGGDANGKFTWMSREPPDSWTSKGDVQRYADGDDAEYFTQVTTDDFLTMWFSPFGTEQGPAWMYSLHTAEQRGARTWTDDTFDNRDTSGTALDMGISPEGFGYFIGSTAPPFGVNTAHTDGGGTAVISFEDPLQTISIAMGSATVGSGATDNQGMRFQLYDQFSWKTVWAWTDGTLVDPSGAQFRVQVADGTHWGGPYIEFDLPQGAWRIVQPVTGPGSDHDISAWFGLAAQVGVRWEIVRYVIRVRVWDASGSEPSTWDEEQFLEYIPTSSVYPYGDDMTKSSRIATPFTALQVEFEGLDPFQPFGPVEITLSEWTVEHDPYGDPADMSVRIERPPATSLGDQVVPYGSSYWVYWGKRDWTDDNSGDDYLAWSSKVWNDPAAAEIQRAEVDSYYFFWFEQEEGGIVSMNWRSSDRQTSARRVLIGDR